MRPYQERLALRLFRIRAPYIDTYRTRVEWVDQRQVWVRRDWDAVRVLHGEKSYSLPEVDAIPLQTYGYRHPAKRTRLYRTETRYIVRGHYDRWLDVLFLGSVEAFPGELREDAGDRTGSGA